MSQHPPAYSAPQLQAPVTQQPTVVTVQAGQAAVAAPNQPRRGNWKGIKATGIFQVGLGAWTIILGIIAVSIKTHLSEVGTGLWCGVLYIVAGILGIVAGQKQNLCAAIGYMVMSIFACLASCVVIGFSASAARGYSDYHGPPSYYFSYYSAGHIAVDAMLLILGIAEFFVSIIGSSMTCSPVCCSSSPSHAVFHFQPQPQVVVAGQPQNVVYYPSGVPPQQYGYPAQQVAGPPQGQFQPTPQGYQYPPPSQAQLRT